MGFYWDIRPDCSSLGATTVRISRPPQHGRLEVRETADFPRHPAADPRSRCNQTEVPGVIVSYTSAVGYVGTDSAVVEALFPDGGHQLVEYFIEVK